MIHSRCILKLQWNNMREQWLQRGLPDVGDLHRSSELFDPSLESPSPARVRFLKNIIAKVHIYKDLSSTLVTLLIITNLSYWKKTNLLQICRLCKTGSRTERYTTRFCFRAENSTASLGGLQNWVKAGSVSLLRPKASNINDEGK